MTEEEDKVCYSAWRRSEAYQVPMTKEGMEMADERYKRFKVGWDYAVKACMLELEKEHTKNKKVHSFFNIAKEILKGLRV
jgi:hypothetical protein